MEKFIGFVFMTAIALGSTGRLNPAIMKLASLAANAQQHQLSYGKFSRMLTHCDPGLAESDTKACMEYRRKMTGRLRRFNESAGKK